MQLCGRLKNIAVLQRTGKCLHTAVLRAVSLMLHSELRAMRTFRKQTRLISWRQFQSRRHALAIVGILQRGTDGALQETTSHVKL